MKARAVMCALSLVGCSGSWGGVSSSVDTSSFDGSYTLDRQESLAGFRDRVQAEADPTRRQQGEALRQMLLDRLEDLTIQSGVIRAGRGLVQEFSLIQAAREGDTLRATAVWHEDVGDPGDSSEVAVTLRLVGDTLEFATFEPPGQPDDTAVFRRATSR